MRTLLITGVCGFVGSSLALRFRDAYNADELRILGIDNLSRPGSSTNVPRLQDVDVEFHRGDVCSSSDLESLPAVDWVIDAAANPSVLAGTRGASSTRELMETNLWGTINLLEYCKQHQAGMILLSTSRVYSLSTVCELPMVVQNQAFTLSPSYNAPGVSQHGLDETFSTRPPISLYGSTKLASEQLAIEYSLAFGFPVWINRCGVMAGKGQFGKPDQGIFSFWLHSWLARRPLQYIGFGGNGFQVRDCLHPLDLFRLVDQQMQTTPNATEDRIWNVSGGAVSARSLAQLSDWCRDRWGACQVEHATIDRPFDVPWMVLDSSLANQRWNWRAEIATETILEEIAEFAEQHPEWLSVSGVR